MREQDRAPVSPVFVVDFKPPHGIAE